MGGQLGQLQFLCWAGKTNIDTDALSRVSWLGCMSDNSGTHLQVRAAAMWAVQDAALEGLTSTIEAYSCNLHILDSVQDSQQVTCMTLEDWHQAQKADPILSLVISRLWDGNLGQWQFKQTDLLQFNQFLHEWNYLLLGKGVLYRRARPRESEETLFSAGFTSCTLRGHSIGMPWWGWSSRSGTHAWPHAWLVLLASHSFPGERNILKSVTHTSLSKPSSPKPLWKTSWPHIL